MHALGTLGRPGLVCLLLLSKLAGGTLVAGVLPDDMKIEKILANSTDVGNLAQSPTGELWLLERTSGRVRIYDSGTETSALTLPVDASCAGGLLDVAFPPDYGSSRRALISYRHTTGALRVDQVVRTASGLEHGPALIDLPSVSGCRPGGGLAFGSDGQLYVGVGDLGESALAQDPVALPGKVLRLNVDGSIPTDNPDPLSPVFASGFRDVRDLAFNPDTAVPGGTLYAADAGEAAPSGAEDEINVVSAAGNYGWDLVTGDSQGTFDDPLIAFGNASGLGALIALRDDGLGSGNAGSLVYVRRGLDRLEQSFLTGGDPASVSSTRTVFDPAGDEDGTPDAGCPQAIDALLGARDNMLYLSSNTANPGIWRVYLDRPGPREVSPRGSPFPLRIDWQGAELLLAWEHLGPLDSGRPARHGGQHAETYQVWEGTLPLRASGYDHTAILATDGTRQGPARRTTTVMPGTGDRYYLVSAQGDNLEGTLGTASDGSRREPSTTDYCPNAGVGRFTGDCIDDFRDPNTGQPMRLIDYNPLSSTYLQPLSIRDFRGKVVHLDVSADNCFLCNLQAPTYHDVDLAYRDRDFMLLTVLNAALSGPVPFPPADCAARIADWSIRHNEHTPVLCDVDLNDDGLGDVSRQYFHLANETQEACGGTPQNFFIDPGGTIFAYRCSYTPGPEVVATIAPEVNPETCE